MEKKTHLILLAGRSGSTWNGRGVFVALRAFRAFLRLLFWGPEDLGRLKTRTRWDE